MSKIKNKIILDVHPPVGVKLECHYSTLWNVVLNEAIKINTHLIEIGADMLAIFNSILKDIPMCNPIVIYRDDQHLISIQFNPNCYRKILFDGEEAFNILDNINTANNIIDLDLGFDDIRL